MAVVWAEDAEGDQVLIRSALDAAEGERIQFAKDGAEAVEAVKQQRPDLVVLDINMPNVDGIEALRRLRAQPDLADVPVVMFSTAKNEDEVLVCEQLGIAAFIQKPVQFEEFTKAVRGIIDLAA
jgi:CheY-like chemotaxis protein